VATSAAGRLTLALKGRSRIASLRCAPETGEPVDCFCLWQPDYALGIVTFDQQITTTELTPRFEAYGITHGDYRMRIRGVRNLPGYWCVIATEFQRQQTEP
jgi:hypothetical protein